MRYEKIETKVTVVKPSDIYRFPSHKLAIAELLRQKNSKILAFRPLQAGDYWIPPKSLNILGPPTLTDLQDILQPRFIVSAPTPVCNTSVDAAWE